MSDALELDCTVCGSPIGPDNRCPVCDAKPRSGRVSARPPAAAPSLDDAPTLGVAPVRPPATGWDDAPTMGVTPVRAAPVSFDDAPTLGVPKLASAPPPAAPPGTRAATRVIGPAPPPGPPAHPGTGRRGPTAKLPRAALAGRGPTKPLRKLGPLIELGIVLGITAAVVGLLYLLAR